MRGQAYSLRRRATSQGVSTGIHKFALEPGKYSKSLQASPRFLAEKCIDRSSQGRIIDDSSKGVAVKASEAEGINQVESETESPIDILVRII